MRSYSNTQTCFLCSRVLTYTRTGECGGTGFAYERSTNRTFCYNCAALSEALDMIETGKGGALYLSRNDAGKPTLSNWCGTLHFNPINVRRSTGYGFNGSTFPVFTFQFIGPDGLWWSGRVAGNMDLARTRRTREKAKCGAGGVFVPCSYSEEATTTATAQSAHP